MADILKEIIDHKRIELASRKMQVPIEFFISGITDNPRTFNSMRRALELSSTGIISEFKRKSPSKGWINRSADIHDVVKSYAANGATAISVLTDSEYFGGSINDLQMASNVVNDTPILRKEFIIDEYQIYEAAYYGADAVLLIAAALSLQDCVRLSRVAHNIGLEVLLEIHNENELEYININVDIVGVNNRNLENFHTDISTSFDIIKKLPANLTLISESGIHNPEIVKDLRQAGYKGFLIGENFMKTSNPGKSLNEFIKKL